jgi:hypothetical protein
MLCIWQEDEKISYRVKMEKNKLAQTGSFLNKQYFFPFLLWFLKAPVCF